MLHIYMHMYTHRSHLGGEERQGYISKQQREAIVCCCLFGIGETCTFCGIRSTHKVDWTNSTPECEVSGTDSYDN